MIKTVREFNGNTTRYAFDTGQCSLSNGFAQVDTRQDASYYGNWANPYKRVLVSYAEGDITIQTADTDEEFATLIRELKKWNEEMRFGFGIDPGWGTKASKLLEAKFIEVGLGDLLH